MKKYEYTYGLLTVMGPEEDDLKFTHTLETDKPFNYYFRENTYNNNVDLVEKKTGKILKTWPLYNDEFYNGMYKHRFYDIQPIEN